MADILGVIGGSGLYEMEGMRNVRRVAVRTPFGDPSDVFTVGELGGRTLAFLPRHGQGHRLSPSQVNYRANVYAMKKIGADAVLSISAVGSMKEGIRPGDIVVVDHFFEHTKFRPGTSFEDGIAGHIVTLNDGSPATNASVEIRGGSFPYEQFAGFADTNGFIRFANVFAGSYAVCASVSILMASSATPTNS